MLFLCLLSLPQGVGVGLVQALASLILNVGPQLAAFRSHLVYPLGKYCCLKQWRKIMECNDTKQMKLKEIFPDVTLDNCWTTTLTLRHVYRGQRVHTISNKPLHFN